MLNELLAQLWTTVQSVEHVSIRLYQSDPLQVQETVLIKNSFFMWCGILAEKASAVLSESNFRGFRGRLIKWSGSVLVDPRGFSYLLETLDEVDDVIISIISSDSSQFKAGMLFKELHCCLSQRSPDMWRVVSPVFRAILHNPELEVETVRFLRNLSNLMSKIHINRKDLLADSVSEYYAQEDLLSAETSVQQSLSSEYSDMIVRIRSVLAEVITSFSMDVPLPKHGPGAVANPGVKSKLDKYLSMEYDARVDYMLRKTTGESMAIYSPFPLSGESRTSRVVFVPKSWKKLRGISAEPTGLQFFQQAVLRGILESIKGTALARLINLGDQSISRDMARRGSRTGSLATIDLSSASDSVTLRLVKDVFGSSLLCRWLLATRSTHTLIEDQVLEINKFAPMGSACCFPVECLLFAGIVLASAAKHFGPRSINLSEFRVYGDDIICPAFMAEDIMSDLVGMGFTVNSGKSYYQGDYRESCGMDAWRGFDVTPLKLKDFSFDFCGSSPMSYEHHSRCVSYLNFLYGSGYKCVRSFFLKKVLDSTVLARKQKFFGRDACVFGDGSRGTVFSTHPDNFHLPKVDLPGLFRSGVQLLVWKPRYLKLSPAAAQQLDEVNYFEWLLLKRASASDLPVSYDLEFFQSADSDRALGLDILQMVPTISRYDFWRPTPLGRGRRSGGRRVV